MVVIHILLGKQSAIQAIPIFPGIQESGSPFQGVTLYIYRHYTIVSFTLIRVVNLDLHLVITPSHLLLYVTNLSNVVPHTCFHWPTRQMQRSLQQAK